MSYQGKKNIPKITVSKEKQSFLLQWLQELWSMRSAHPCSPFRIMSCWIWLIEGSRPQPFCAQWNSMSGCHGDRRFLKGVLHLLCWWNPFQSCLLDFFFFKHKILQRLNPHFTFASIFATVWQYLSNMLHFFPHPHFCLLYGGAETNRSNLIESLEEKKEKKAPLPCRKHRQGLCCRLVRHKSETGKAEEGEANTPICDVIRQSLYSCIPRGGGVEASCQSIEGGGWIQGKVLHSKAAGSWWVLQLQRSPCHSHWMCLCLTSGFHCCSSGCSAARLWERRPLSYLLNWFDLNHARHVWADLSTSVLHASMCARPA